MSTEITSSKPDVEAGVAGKPEEKKKLGNVDIDEHMLPIEEVCERYGTQVNQPRAVESQGLAAAEIAARLARDGPNILSPPKRISPFIQYLIILSDLFNVLLIIAGVLCFILFAVDTTLNKEQVIPGSVLIGVAFINALVEFVQHQKSQAIMESFMDLIPAKAIAIRDGKLQNVPASELVQGDVVYIRMGDKVPADVLLFAATDLKVDNSSLTGEAEPQERTFHNTHETPLEATNLIFNGTLAVNGEGYGIVIRTGDRTVLGQIAGLTAGEEKGESPMSREIKSFVIAIASVAIVIAIIFFFVALFARGNGSASAVAFAVNLAIGTFVSFVPQGLPATVTSLLSIAAQRMKRRNVLVKDLQGVETLGAITMLATDKTGTLTRNQMTLTYVWTGAKTYYALNVSNSNVLPENVEELPLDAPGVPELLNMAALCQRCKFDRTDVPVEKRNIVGDATEAGLVRFVGSKLEKFDEMQDTYPKVFEIPFNSETKWHLSVHKKKHDHGDLTLYIKGAPERILRLCDKYFDGEKAVPLTEEHRNAFNETYRFMASKGHRVLAFANLYLDGAEYPENYEFSKDPVNYPNKNFIFHGLVSLEDPPKHGVREAIGRCREAGIKVMMVTGDHPLTAEAIGRKINLMLQDTKQMVADKSNRKLEEVGDDEYNAIVIHGEQIDKLIDADWENIFSKEEIIFARTSPRHKLDIVKRAQSRGHIVGVTGDGVNDSPALKKADLGIAMNQSGSDVSKEAAAMILLDDNFASTVSGIEEGRLIFLNLKKSIMYTISHTMPEFWAQLLLMLVPIPTPLSIILILLIDLGFDFAIALSFAWDPAESSAGLMKLPPRKPVTEASVEKLYRRRVELLQFGIGVDESTGDKLQQSLRQKWSYFVYRLQRFFTKRFWAEMMEDTDEEVLVDVNVMSWAYLEAGTIISLGCFVAYFVALWDSYGVSISDAQRAASSDPKDEGYLSFDPKKPFTLNNGRVLSIDEQLDASGQAMSMFYIGILLCQFFNMIVVKAKLGYPWGSFLFQNWRNYAAFGIGCLMVVIFVYIPPVNKGLFTSYRTSPLYWLIPIAFGLLLYVYAWVRIWVNKKRRPIKFTREIIGLQMYPTRWSTRGSNK